MSLIAQTPKLVAIAPMHSDSKICMLVKNIADKKCRSSFQDVYSDYYPKVRNLLMKQGASKEDAEEVAQETMSTVWQKAHMFNREKGTFSSWIFTIARNKRIDKLRKHVVWQEYDEAQDNRISEDKLPDEIAEQQQTASMISKMLSELPVEQREIVELSFVFGLSHAEIAQKKDMPIGTIKSRLRLAYQKLRTAFEEQK